ncbi:MAG: 16S rRNA (cytidine(1402)-2'-O)-methyltransferase, partial [candidate division WOR-3 bacterium]
RLAALVDETRTVIFLESARRLIRLLNEIGEVLGDRRVVVCRELTKKYEEIIRGRVSEVLEVLTSRKIKGEVVVVVSGYEERDQGPR